MPRDGAKTLNGAVVTRNETETSPKEKQKAPKELDPLLKEAEKPSREAANAARAFRLGLFIVGSLAVLAIGIFLIGNREMLFSSTYTLKSNFQTVAGLSEGADVRVGGMHEGTVKHIDLPKRPEEKVTVVMDMHKATRDVLKSDSVASIKSEGLLGDKYMEISFGSPDAQSLKNGDTIASSAPLDISDLIAKTSTILDSTKGAVDNIEGAADNLKSISAKVNDGKGTVGALVNDKTIYREAAAGATAFQENMEALKHNFFLRGFFRKRGYEDANDLRAHQIAQLPAEPPLRKFEYDPAKIFDKPNTAKLKNQKALDETGRFLETNKFGLAVVAAATGMKGDTEKNRQLTEARSMVVRDYMTQNFKFDDTRLKTIGLGKSQDAGDSGKLEIIVYPASAGAPVARKP
jgi:phospholipid/cholesterol/gamma-HCH transport system substrate-binding protein